jgi:hypothetical protein
MGKRVKRKGAARFYRKGDLGLALAEQAVGECWATEAGWAGGVA